LEVEENIWKKGVGKDASMRNLGPCHRIKGGIYAKKGESIFTIKRGKRESTGICGRPVEKGIYPTLQVTPDIASTLCGEERWHTENGTRLSTHKLVDDKKWVPLPLIADILDGVGKRKVFIKLDLRWGYNNVRIREGDKWKAAFTIHIRAYEPTVMYFGLTNSPATFQVMMNDLFRDLINQGDTATFIDDILVATDTEEEHNELVEEVLKRLEENDLFVKPEKCKWKVREVEFLGVVIGPKGVEMQREKVKGVLNWPAPRNVKEVQKFLGLANYYRRFIKDFARIAALLHVLVRKEQKWKWKKEQEEVFENLKAGFTTEPVLAIPDIDKEMRVEADASDYVTGGVLSTKCEDGKWRPVVFISKSLNTTERNYKIHDKEMLAVIRCLEAWRHYLEEAKLEFEIWTDHKNL